MIEYTLSRSNRKTVALYVRDGFIEVRAPKRMAKRDIDRFVASKEQWAKRKLAELKKRAEEKREFLLNYGELVTYRGKEYPITGRQGIDSGIDYAGFYMPEGLTEAHIKENCIQIYRENANLYLPERTFYFAEILSVRPKSVKISNAKSLWGSCSRKKSINYSWRIMMADDDVIDYLVVHELAHLIELNHSARYWKIVEKLLPDYRARRAKLRTLQKKLSIEDWD